MHVTTCNAAYAVLLVLQGFTKFDVYVQNSKFFQMFDVDGDGLISYSEYLLLITFLSIPVEVSCKSLPFSALCE